jgi:hypothetical protein
LRSPGGWLGDGFGRLFKFGIVGSLPLWAGVVGDTFGGIATDWLLVMTGRGSGSVW